MPFRYPTKVRHSRLGPYWTSGSHQSSQLRAPSPMAGLGHFPTGSDQLASQARKGAAARVVGHQGREKMAVQFIISDLEFILDQIIIAERNAAGESLLDILPNVEVPFGLRTVDGSFNNLVPGQSDFGSADGTFPRLTDPVFNPAEPVAFDPDGPAGQAVGNPTSYAQTSGAVFDSQPRVISNLVVDQTANNPAAYATAYD